MKRIQFLQAKEDSHLVTIVNKVFHDIEAESYVDRHPEIYEYEASQWKSLIAPLLIDYRRKKQSSITLLDVGTGIGFVPASISALLLESDTVVFSDISNGMLQKAEEFCKKYNFNKVFTSVDEQYSQISDSSIDIVTLNSVLHHIAAPQELCTQIDRVLRPGGVIIIKHEPNILFGDSMILRNLYTLLKRIRSAGKRSTVIKSLDDIFLKRVVTKLRTEEDIEFTPALSKLELQQIVDIHSPTAGGGLDIDRGFNPLKFCALYFTNYKILRMNTYGYFGKIRDDKNFIRKICSTLLRIILPGRGYFFDIVIQKSN